MHIFQDGSLISKIPGIMVGDHIEKINDNSMIGRRHFEVAKTLKEIPLNNTFTLRLVEPEKSAFGDIQMGKSKKGGSIGSGKETLRLRAGGNASVEAFDDATSAAVEKINKMLEGFLGISDEELARSIWELGNKKSNPSEFVTNIEESDLKSFGFTETFIFELWGAISDAKQGRLNKMRDINEKF